MGSLARLAAPIAAIDRPLVGGKYSSVVCDNYSAAQLAMRHPVDHGHMPGGCRYGPHGHSAVIAPDER